MLAYVPALKIVVKMMRGKKVFEIINFKLN